METCSFLVEPSASLGATVRPGQLVGKGAEGSDVPPMEISWVRGVWLRKAVSLGFGSSDHAREKTELDWGGGGAWWR